MRKILSIMLSLLMVFSIIPIATFSVSAADYTVTTEEDFVKYLGGNNVADNVTLGADIIVTTPIKNATGKVDKLDLAGFTVTYAPADPETTDAMISELNSTYDASALNVTNSVEGQGGFVNESGLPLFATTGKGSINFTTGEFNGDITAKIEGNSALTFNGAASVVNGNVNIEGNVSVTNTVTFAESINCTSLSVTKAAIVEKNIAVNAFYAEKGTFNGNITAVSRIKAKGSDIVFNGLLNADLVALGVGTKATQTIEANEFYALDGTYSDDVTIKSKGTIIGGTFNGKLIVSDGADVVVAGGTVSALEGSIVAKGGKFKFDPTEFLGEHATAADNSGTFTVTNNAFEVNGVEYSTTSSAVSNAGEGDTVKLVDDYYVTTNNTTVFTITKDNITIDLNGKTITDLSDTDVFSGYNKFLYCNSVITKFTLTDSTYETTGGGKVYIQGGGSNGGTEYCVAFKNISGETPVELTFENCSIITNNSCWVNNGGAMQLSGGSTADNVVNFTNFALKNTGTHALTGQGFNGISLSMKATINADNFDLYAERNALLCYADNLVFNFKNSKIGTGRNYTIKLNESSNTNCVVNAENTKFYSDTEWANDCIVFGTNEADTTQNFVNCTFELYKGAAIASSGSNNNILIKDSIFTYTSATNSYPIYLAGTDTAKVYNSQFKQSYVDSRIASINAGATLILDKNTTAVNTANSSSNAQPAFYMKGTSEEVKASLKLNYFTMSGYRNFVNTANAYADIYIEDFSIEKDANAGQWNGGDKFVTNASATVTLGEGYGIYEGDNEEATEDFVWSASNYKDKKLKVYNPNLRLATVEGETYKVNAGSEFELPVSTNENYKGYTSDHETLVQAGEKVVVNENIVFDTIEKIISDEDFTIDTSNQTYTGEALKPEVTSELEEGIDYEVSYADNTELGEGTVTVKGIGKCFGTVSATFTIVPPIVEAEFGFDLADKVYTGSEIKPEVTCSDTYTADDYEVSYENNTDVGIAKIIVTGKGSWGGRIEKTFNITTKTLEDTDFGFTLDDQTFTGLAIEPAVTAEALKSTDYDVVYTNNTNVGTATITVTGKINCTGIIEKTFKINEKALEQADFSFDLSDKEYSGDAFEPTPVIENEYITADDYDIDYINNIDVGTATITVTGKRNFKGTLTYNFKLTSKAIAESDFNFTLDDQTYAGSAITPKVTSDKLKLEKDYDVVYTNNTNVGTATITVNGKGNYSGVLIKTFEIVAKNIDDSMFEFDLSNKTFRGTEFNDADGIVKPVSFLATGTDVSESNLTLVYGQDYTTKYENNLNAGTATVTVTGQGNFGGEIVKTFVIDPLNLKETDFAKIEDQVYDFTNKLPALETFNELITSADYDAEYTNNKNVGTATVTITGKNNFKGTVVRTFEITPKTITKDDFIFTTNDQSYTGKAIEPKVITTVLSVDDYKVEYDNNTELGTATIRVIGQGNCTGKVEETFKIVKRALALSDFVFDIPSEVIYSGEAVEPAVSTVNLRDDDYKVSYANNINAGTASIIIEANSDNCSGTVEKTFLIRAKSIEEANFTFDLNSKVYTGGEIKPEVTSDTLLTDDYIVTYQNNINQGTATITVIGQGNYCNTVEKEFEITQKTINESDFTAATDKVYTGEAIENAISSEMLSADDYTVTYTNNVNAGTATATIIGKGNCVGTVEMTFEIAPKAIEESNFIFDTDDRVYTGSSLSPEVTSNVLSANDYKVTYANNVNAGTATITVIGTGNYTGTVEKTFKITPKALQESMLTVDTSVEIYTGAPITKAVKSTVLTANDYTVTYANNLNVGTATLTVTGKGNYVGTFTKTFTIVSKILSESMFTADTKAVTYTGKPVNKTVTSKLTLNVDYTVSLINNVNVGTGKIIIKGIGNYSDTVEFAFTIKKPSVSKLKKVTASASSKKVTLKWKKVKGANGYVIKYSLKKNFKGSKTITVKSAKAAKRVINKLKSNKQYYFKVAAYKNYKNSKNKTVKAIGKYVKLKKPVLVK
ncbi:MAG: hypothetical protein ACI39F_00740 [Acutalibacteraceae bacterium]